jgi:uncharacterized membrane protein YraQ (UPF0718 family)
MAQTEAVATASPPPVEPRRRLRLKPELVFAVLALAAGARGLIASGPPNPYVATWSTVFTAIVVQALPFVVLGVLVSGLIASHATPAALARVIPGRPGVAVPAAAVAGLLLPGCECGSVPVAGRLRSRGVPAGAAAAFMLSAPAVNPVVLVATAVAFPGQPRMVLARLLGSLLCATAVGLVWSRTGNDALMRPAIERAVSDTRRWTSFSTAARDDLVLSAGWLVVGAGAAATMQAVVPRSVLGSVAGVPVVSALALAALAVVLSICSEADAFVAASLREFSPAARLVFLVVGPVIDLKLMAMQSGVFGRRFVLRFAPLTFVLAVASGLLVGWVLL